MEFNSVLSTKRKASANMDVFTDLINDYNKTAQDMTQIDPNQLQTGQSIYDDAGMEYVVVEDPEGTTNKVIMPAEEQGSQIPEVEVVEDTEIQTSYNVQPTEGVTMAQTAKEAQEYDEYNEGVDWDEIRSIILDMNAFVKQQNMQGLTMATEELTNFILSHMEIPEGLDLPLMASKSAGQSKEAQIEVLPEFRKQATPEDNFKHSMSMLKKAAPMFKKIKLAQSMGGVPETSVHPDVYALHEPKKVCPEFDTSLNSDEEYEESYKKELCDESCEGLTDDLGINEGGFVEIMDDIIQMIDTGVPTVDLLLIVGEKYPREEGEVVLEEARKRGIL